MTSQEKAKELVFKFEDTMEFSTPQRFAKECALIAVDEVLNSLDYDYILFKQQSEYWNNVKQELENL